jgi:hypothetical protein
MAMGIPTILVGHLKGPYGGNYGGVVSKEKIEAQEYHNLSGRESAIVATPAALADDITMLLTNTEMAQELALFGRQYIARNCSVGAFCDYVESEIKRIYR